MNLSKTSVRSRIAFWVGQGVIIEKENDVFIAATSFNSQMNGKKCCTVLAIT